MTVVDLRPDPSTVPATMTSYQRMMAEGLAPLTVACDRCGQQPGAGMYCQSKSGYTTSFHAARLAAVAHLSTDEKIAAFGSMRAAERRAHDEANARLAVLESDPAYIARRDATRRWIDEQITVIDRDLRVEEFNFRSRCTDAPFKGQRSHADGCRCLHTGEVEYTPEFARARRDRERDEALRGTLPVTDLANMRGRR